jgi:hypothetical protein
MFKQTITPNPNIPAEEGMCLQYVRQTFNLPVRYGSATEAWNNSASKHTDRNFPAGVAHPVWYGLASNVNGHVVLRMADGSVYSTSDYNPNPVHHHPSLADLEAYYAKYGVPLTYRGWTEDVAGYTVIAPVTPTPEKDELDMANAQDLADAIFNKRFTNANGKGDVTLGQIVAWYDANRANDIDGIFAKQFNREGGQKGVTNLGSTVAWLDANLQKIVSAEAAQNAQISNLVSAIAAVAKGQPFDQAKLLAGIQASAAAGVKDAISSIDTTVTLK